MIRNNEWQFHECVVRTYFEVQYVNISANYCQRACPPCLYVHSHGFSHPSSPERPHHHVVLSHHALGKHCFFCAPFFIWGTKNFLYGEKKKSPRKWSQSPRKKSPRTQELTHTIIFIREIYMVPHIKPTPV